MSWRLIREVARTSRPAAIALPAYTSELRDKFGVTIVGSIDELLAQVDVVLLESVDGRPHLEQARPVFKAHKPVFIDKPVAGTLADAIAIFDLARETNTPCFSSSSLRFSAGIAAMRHQPKVGDVLGCDAYGPCHLEEHHPDLFWYGDPWRRDALHHHGHRLPDGFPHADRGDRSGRGCVERRTRGDVPRHPRRPCRLRRDCLRLQRHCPQRRRMAATSRWSSRSSSSSRPASRP